MIKTNMMQKTLNLAPIAFTVAVAAGVMFHDMHLDRASTVALAMPAMLATYGAAHFMSANEHIHVERVAFSNQSRVFHSSLPKITPRDDEPRYIQGKKALLSGSGTSLWPSI